jgi:quinol monooxygenase YgiN
MAIMLKIRWEIKQDREPEFRRNQEKLCAVMSAEHPGVICYHVDYPAPGVSEWTEIYANNQVFKAHLDNPKGEAPLAALIDACDRIGCRCWGDADADSRKLLVGFGTTYHDTAKAAFVLHPRADRASLT